MSVYDPRVDAYIEQAAPFAQEILTHLRDLIHLECPEIEETMKWSAPHFEYKGRPLFHMAGFKQHCAFGFWLASLMGDPKGILQLADKASMGSLGKLTSVKDLPADKILVQYIRASLKLADEGARPAKAVRAPAREVPVPEFFSAALKKNKRALAVFEAFSPSHRNEYLAWIMEAKREETRDKRVAQAIEWMSEGKQRHWKYQA